MRPATFCLVPHLAVLLFALAVAADSLRHRKRSSFAARASASASVSTNDNDETDQVLVPDEDTEGLQRLATMATSSGWASLASLSAGHWSPPPRNCSSCVDRDLYKNFTREEIRERILRQLGFSAPPNTTTEEMPIGLIKQLLSKYRTEFDVQADEGAGHRDYEDDLHFKTMQINLLAKKPTDADLGYAVLPSTWSVHLFRLQSVPQLSGLAMDTHAWWRDVVGRASLWVHLPAAPSPADKHAWVNVFYVSVDKNAHPFLTQESSNKVKLRQDRGGWVDINLHGIVAMWLKDPSSNLGIVVQINTGTGEEITVDANDSASAPFLQLDVREATASSPRRKRTLSKVCREETDAGETHCCLWPFTVDFEKEFGWKWIIYPAKYEANFCSGDCSLGVMMPSNPWAHLLQQANGSPCCAPQKMSGINMLYMDENRNVILGKLPNMKVDRCGCA